jgi:predicted nucleotidyltransferase
MENTKNKLSEYEINFFNHLSEYLDTRLYFFGSIQRNDYLPKSSDIDVDIFTNNESSTITKLMYFLNVENRDFKRFVWKLNVNNKLVYGKKIMYKDTDNNLSVEFSIYNEKDKDNVLYEHNYKNKLPYYAVCLLIFLKYLYYKFNILPKTWYKSLKAFILNILVYNKPEFFVVIDVKNKYKTNKLVNKYN